MPSHATGKDSLNLLVQRLQDGPKAAKAAIRSGMEMGDGVLEGFALDKVPEKANRPTSALRHQRTRMYEELRKMQAPGPRSKSNSTLREVEGPLSDVDSPKSIRPVRLNNQSDMSPPRACAKLDLERLPSGAKLTDRELDPEQNLSCKSPNLADLARSEVQARPATRDCALLSPDALAQQRKALTDKFLAGTREDSRTKRSRRQKNLGNKAPVLSNSTSAPSLGKPSELLFDARLDVTRDTASNTTLPPAGAPEVCTEVRTEAAREIWQPEGSHGSAATATATPCVTAAAPAAGTTAAMSPAPATAAASMGDRRCGTAPAKARATKHMAWLAPEPRSTPSAIAIDEPQASPSGAPATSSKEAKGLQTAWATQTPAGAAATAVEVAASALAATAAPESTPAATASNSLSTGPEKDKLQSTTRATQRSRKKGMAKEAEAKIANALKALDMKAEALLEAAVGKRSPYQTGKPDFASLLAEIKRASSERVHPAEDQVDAHPSHGRVPEFLNRRGTSGTHSDKAEKLDGAKKKNSLEKFDGANFLAETDKTNLLNEMESPSMFEAYLPASALDLLELESSRDFLGGSSNSKSKPCKLVNALEELPYSIPFDLGTWEQSAPDVFGANLLEPSKANNRGNNKGKGKLKVPHKSKREPPFECSVQTDIKTATENSSKDVTMSKGLSSTDSSAVAASVKPTSSADKAAQPERRRPQSANESGSIRPVAAAKKAPDAPATDLASSKQQAACKVLRPSSATATRETLSRLGGFDMPDSNVPYSAWDTCKEVYSAWGDSEEWEDAANDWGMDDVSMQLLVH